MRTKECLRLLGADSALPKAVSHCRPLSIRKSEICSAILLFIIKGLQQVVKQKRPIQAGSVSA